MGRKAIIFLISQENAQTAFYREYCEENKNHPKFEFLVSGAGEEAANLLSEYDGGVLFFSISNKPHMMDLLKFFQLSKSLIKKGLVKVSGYNNINNPKVVKYLKENGVQEIFEAPLSNRSISFKIDLWFKGIDFAIKKYGDNNDSDKKLAVGNKKNQNAQTPGKLTKKASTGVVKYLPALNLQSDCWLVENKANLQFSMNNWIVELIGPGPAAGHWNDVAKQKNSETPIWKWIPFREEIFQFIVNDGAWVFQGREPMFNWETNKWKFISSRPHLYFESERNKSTKFLGTSGQLEIAENSSFGKQKLSLIEESLDPKYNFSKNADNNSDNAGTGETEVIDSYLRGKNSVDSEKMTGAENPGKVSSGEDTNRLSTNLKSKAMLRQDGIDAQDSLQEIKQQLQVESAHRAKNVGPGTGEIDEQRANSASTKKKLNVSNGDLEATSKDQLTDVKQRKNNLRQEDVDSEHIDQYYRGTDVGAIKENSDLKSMIDPSSTEVHARKKSTSKFSLEESTDVDNEEIEQSADELEVGLENEAGISDGENLLNRDSSIPLSKKKKNTLTQDGNTEGIDSKDENGKVLPLRKKRTDNQSAQELDSLNKEKKGKKEKNSLDLMEEVDDFLSTSNDVSSFGESTDDDDGLNLDVDLRNRANPHKSKDGKGVDEPSTWNGVGAFKEKNKENNVHRQHNDEMEDHLNDIEKKNKDWEKYLRGGAAKREAEVEEDKWSGPSGNRNNFKNKGNSKHNFSDEGVQDSDPSAKEKLKNYFADNFVEKEEQNKNYKGIKIGQNKIDIGPMIMEIFLKTKNPQSQVFSNGVLVSIVDQFEDLIVLSNLTDAPLETSMQVLIDCQISYKGKGLKFSMVGTIQGLDALEDQPGQINVQLTNFNQDHLNALYEILTERQANISAFIKAAKGG